MPVLMLCPGQIRIMRIVDGGLASGCKRHSHHTVGKMGIAMSPNKKGQNDAIHHTRDGLAPVLEVILRGVHEDRSVISEIQTLIKVKVEEHNPDILVINLLDFGYRCDDDVFWSFLLTCLVLFRGESDKACRIT